MTFTYSGDPSASDLELARFLIGDTNPAVPLFSDQEISAVLTKSSNVYWGSVNLIDAAVARYAFMPDRMIDGMDVRWSVVVENLKSLRSSLVDRATTSSFGGASFYAGGLSEAERDVDLLDTELSQPAFRRNQFGNKVNPP